MDMKDIQNTFKMISKQAMDTFDTAKIELKIKGYIKDCNEIYCKIGKLVYEARKEDGMLDSDALTKLTKKIDDYKAKIQELEIEKNNIKNNFENYKNKKNTKVYDKIYDKENNIEFLKFCPECQTGNTPDSTCCAKCGYIFNK